MDAAGTDLDPVQLESLQRPPRESGRDLESILEELTLAGQPGIYHPSGGHMSYIPNAGLYTAALGEFLAAGLNRFLHARLKRRQVRRSVYQAMKFVAYDG